MMAEFTEFLTTVGVNPVSAFLLVLATVGATEMFKRFMAGDWKAGLIIAFAGAVGTGFALCLGIHWCAGLIVGWAASGAVTLTNIIANFRKNGSVATADLNTNGQQDVTPNA